MTNRYLGIGINKYPRNPLAGCVNDVRYTADILAQCRGWDVDTLHVCTDKRAHADGYRERLNWLVKDLTPDDHVILWLSHHGSTRPTHYEEDGRDEVLCPVDYDADHYIGDDEFSEIMSAVPEGCYALVIADVCFGGGLQDRSDKESTRRSRFIPPASPEDALLPLRRRVLTPEKLPQWGIVSASGETQPSEELLLNSEPRGVFSAFFQRIVTRSDLIQMPLSIILDDVRDRLALRGYEQIPQYRGPDWILRTPFAGGGGIV